MPLLTPAALREWRASLGLSQAEFARMVGAESGRTVRRWEAGDRLIPAYIVILRDLCAAHPSAGRWLTARAQA